MKPVVDRLQGQYADQIDFLVYPAVDQDSSAGSFANQHGVQAVPTMVLVTPDGTETERWVGAQPEQTLRARFEMALADAQ